MQGCQPVRARAGASAVEDIWLPKALLLWSTHLHKALHKASRMSKSLSKSTYHIMVVTHVW